jgi:hypothetical protein
MIDLTARFTLDVDKTREWIANLIDPDADLADAAAEVDLAEDWHSGSAGAEWTAERLVQAAMDDGVIGCPAEMEVYFDYDDREDGGYYRFLVDIGADVATMVRLATLGYEVRKLGDTAAKGADAALAVLSEAVVSANGALDNLSALIAQEGTR